MPTKPIVIPDWALSLANVVEPPESLKQSGFLTGERPGPGTINWLHSVSGAWIDHLVNQYRLSMRELWGPLGLSFGASQSNTQVSPQLAVTSGSDTSGQVIPPGGVAGGPSPHVSLELTHLSTSSNDDILVHQRDTGGSSYLTVADVDDLWIRVDVRVQLSDASQNNELDVVVGLHGSPAAGDVTDPTVAPFVEIAKLTGETNWRLRVANGTTGSDVDLNAAPSNDAWQHLRIDYFGSATPEGLLFGGAPVARAYVDSVLSGQLFGANLPSGADGLGLMVRYDSSATGPAAAETLSLSPIAVGWNPVVLV